MAWCCSGTKSLVTGLSVIAVGLLLANFFSRSFLRQLAPEAELYSGGTKVAASTLSMTQSDVGPAPEYNARITNVQIIDFDEDGLRDVIVCDAQRNSVLWYRQRQQGQWVEHMLGDDLIAPAHATVVDLDRDGDQDVVVSILGSLNPVDDLVGRVVWLEATEDGYRQQVLLDDIRRVADVQAGDMDADGDIDLVVAVFGHSRGEILWLECVADGRYQDHQLHSAPGTIHVPLADYDGDGDLDIAAVVSQEEEEVWCFENLSGGRFHPRRVYFTVNFDVGSAGLVVDDLDSDGDADLLLPLGDNLEHNYAYPQPYHGCLWLENLGGWKFAPRRIAHFGGTYAAAAGDLDRDGDRDVVLVSMVNEWQKPGHASVVWLQNDGSQNFRMGEIARQPTHLATVACGDLDSDGRDDIVAGVMKVLVYDTDPHGRIVAWTSNQKESP